MTDIKPCPFCKCTNSYVEYHFNKGSDGTCYEVAWVVCPVCDARGPQEAFPHGMSITEAAIRAWNER